MDCLIVGIVFIVFSIFPLLFITFLLRKAMFLFNPLFALSNYIQWICYNPIRWMYKNTNSEFPRKIHLFLKISLISPVLTLIIHILLTPLRVINAIYYDILLYWSVMLDDSLQEVFNPKRGTYRTEKGIKFAFHWVYALPFRIINFVIKSFVIVFDSFLMFGISCLLPTFTMYHGTAFDKAAAKIGQSGKWLVGSGNWAGTGLYFAIAKKVAVHYSTQDENAGILIVRFSPTFTRNAVTLKKDIRQLVGNNGEQLSKKLKFPYRTIEHYRTSMGGWWEYCLVRPGQMKRFIDSWRIRPVAVLKENKISRLWGGFSLYSSSVANITVGLMCWGVLLAVLFQLIQAQDNYYF